MFRPRISLKWFLLGTAAIAVLLGMGKRYYDYRQWLGAPAAAGSREAFNPQKHHQWMARQQQIRKALRADVRGWDGYLTCVYVLPITDRPSLALLSEATRLEEFGGNVPLTDADLLWAENHPNLRRLMFIEGISNDSMAIIGTCQKLEQLMIESSTITDEGLTHLRGLEHLEKFDLFKSPVTGRGMASLRGLPRLFELRLIDSQIDDEGLKAIGQLRQLEMLDLSGTKINGTGLAHLEMLSALRTLNLHSTMLVDCSGLEQLDTIHQLGLYGIRLRQGILKDVAKMDSLESLLLMRSTVTDDLLAELSHARQIRELHLEETTVGDSGLMHLAKMSGLRELNLRNTKVTDDGLVHLESLRDLRLLNLGATAVTEASVLRLAHALPKARIIYGVTEIGPSAD